MEDKIEVEEQIKELQDKTNKESREKELSEIERDLEVTMNNDFDELERIILNDIDLSDETVQWLYDILHKNMNLFFKHIMQRLKNKNYL